MIDKGEIVTFKGPYGFARIKLNNIPTDVFFNEDSYRGLIFGEKSLKFDMRNFKPLTRTIKVGLTIYFTYKLTEKGLRAKAWCFADEYKEAEKLFNKRPLYKLMLSRGVNGSSNVEEVWKGSESEFGDRFLVMNFNPVLDTLYPEPSITRWWEVSYDQGKSWEKCDPPFEYVRRFNAIGEYGF